MLAYVSGSPMETITKLLVDLLPETAHTDAKEGLTARILEWLEEHPSKWRVPIRFHPIRYHGMKRFYRSKTHVTL